MQDQQSKSTFAYDSSGRKRIATEYTWDANANGGAGGWTQSDQTRYIYDGMDLVQEQDAQGNVKASFVRDGNIGGVLSMTNADGTFDYHYDGNGNVVALTDSNQNIVAQYSYDAYGNLISSSGSEADKNPFRFSSKYYDSDTGLYDYGARHYDPSLGRWINRDPSGESGGLNLYGMTENNPVNLVDTDGRQVGEGAVAVSTAPIWGPPAWATVTAATAAAIAAVGRAGVDAWNWWHNRNNPNNCPNIQTSQGRQQVSKDYPTQKRAKEGAIDNGGLWQKNGKTMPPEKDEEGWHYHDKNHDNPSKPNVHHRFPK